MPPAETFKAGILAFNDNRFVEALQSLAKIYHPQAQHLSAISAQRLGRYDEAHRFFAQASKLAPNDPNIANNRGHFELTRGHYVDARKHFLTALKSTPSLVPALIGIAKIQAVQKNWQDAIECWKVVLDHDPSSRVARYGLGTALLEAGFAEEAIQKFRQLLTEKEAPEPRFMLGRAYLQRNELLDAEFCFQKSYESAPSEHAFMNLANLYWMRGDEQRFEALTQNAPSSLAHSSVQALIDSGNLAEAEIAWNNMFSDSATDPSAWLLRAQIARQRQNAVQLASAADSALTKAPDDLLALDMRIVADLMNAKPSAALKRLGPVRNRAPLMQHWLAHEFVAKRLLEYPSPLTQADPYIAVYDLATPPGYANQRSFNDELADALRDLHPFSNRPLNQSLRGAGTQTTRDLLSQDHPAIRAFVNALDEPIKQYLEEIGTGDFHPTSARNTGNYSFSGMWSVRLRDGGYHEAHVHPEGWISSAYYVVVPDDIENDPDKAGWIEFGIPPYQTNPQLPAVKQIAPRVGQLVLFPSFMWHNTRPLRDACERITAPFDLVPDGHGR
jgi:Flp pilus assembly protein TadD